MSGPMLSRSQRRMEKRQALILLVVVLAVALASFVLGVLVGRSGSPGVVRQSVPSRPPVASAPSPPTAREGASEAVPATERLTFYETLSKGEDPPLGSGINLPPEQKRETAEERPASASPVPSSEKPVPSEVDSPGPEPVAGGSFLVQAASFREAEAARSLQEKLAGKGYPATIQEVDLGSRGVWYRVLAGAYGSEDQADRAVADLKREFRLSAMVRKP